MDTRVGSPFSEACEGGFRMAFQIGADAELRRETLGELILRLHGVFEVVEPEPGHKEGMRKVEEGGHPIVGDAFQTRAERMQEDLQSVGVMRREIAVKVRCDLVGTSEEREWFVSHKAGADEGCRFKAREYRREGIGELARNFDPELIFESLCHEEMRGCRVLLDQSGARRWKKA